MSTIFSKKSLMLFVLAVLCIMIAFSFAGTFALYSHQANGNSTTAPRGEYFMEGSTFEFIDNSVHESFAYNFYLTNVNEYGGTNSDFNQVNIAFLLSFNEILSSHLTDISIEINYLGKWRSVQHVYSGDSVEFLDSWGFSPTKGTINYYRINFTLDKALQFSQETSLFSLIYKVKDEGNTPNTDITDPSKQIETEDFKGKTHKIYLGKIKETLVNANDFRVVKADIPSNILIVNVHFHGILQQSINVKTDVFKEGNTTYSQPYLIVKGSGYKPTVGYFTDGYAITVYRPYNFGKGVEIYETKL